MVLPGGKPSRPGQDPSSSVCFGVSVCAVLVHLHQHSRSAEKESNSERLYRGDPGSSSGERASLPLVPKLPYMLCIDRVPEQIRTSIEEE